MTPPLNPNAITRTHAEGDVFNQAAQVVEVTDRATLYADRALRGAWGRSGGIKSMARALGVKELTVVRPAGRGVIVNDASVNPNDHVTLAVGLVYEFLRSENFQG